MKDKVTIPTDAEIETLAQELRQSKAPTYALEARWILERYEPRSEGQRCDGSGQLHVFQKGQPNYGLCPGCPRCATPKGEGGVGSAWCTEHQQLRSLCDLPTHRAEPVAPKLDLRKLNDEVNDAIAAEKRGYSRGHADGLAAARKLDPPPIELGPRTLRALVAGLNRAMANGGDAGSSVLAADALLAELDKGEK